MRIGTTGTETPFLPESEIPDHSKSSGELTSLTEEERKQILLAKEREWKFINRNLNEKLEDN